MTTKVFGFIGVAVAASYIMAAGFVSVNTHEPVCAAGNYPVWNPRSAQWDENNSVCGTMDNGATIRIEARQRKTAKDAKDLVDALRAIDKRGATIK